MARKPKATTAAKKKPAAKKATAPASKKAVKTVKAPVAAKAPAAAPLRALRDEIDRVFEDFDKGFGMWPRRGRLFDIEPFFAPFRRLEPVWGDKQPTADVVESDKEFRVTAEMPGIEEKDVEVTVSDGMLTIKGEKSEEKEEKKKDYHVSERRYGSFRRSFNLPKTVDLDKVQATMKNGVLSVVLPKTSDAEKSAKKIDIAKG